MQCERCGERPAAIHLTQIKDNEVSAVHLCETCAEEQGVQTGTGKLPLAGFLASVGSSAAVAAAALPAGMDDRECDYCHSTLRDFRETGRLGCPHCYDSFETHLRELMRRIHGSSKHVGEVYLSPNATPSDSADLQIVQLKDQLRRSVESENFELAAELRDRIRTLE